MERRLPQLGREGWLGLRLKNGCQAGLQALEGHLGIQGCASWCGSLGQCLSSWQALSIIVIWGAGGESMLILTPSCLSGPQGGKGKGTGQLPAAGMLVCPPQRNRTLLTHPEAWTPLPPHPAPT